jgi:hypothetical protein
LRFEELTSQPALYLNSLASFLDREPISNRIPDFAELHKINPKFFRSGRNDTWKTAFSREDDELFRTLHGKIMTQFGYNESLIQ